MATRPPEPKHARSLPAKCNICGRRMTIIRREAHPERGGKYELQTFACKCGQILKRTASSPGQE
jgi:hypothetical protein